MDLLTAIPLLTALLFPWEQGEGFDWLPPAQKPLVLTFTGDIMAHDVNYKMSDFSKIYESLAPILLEDDLSFANLEAPVDPHKPYSSYPSFNVHPEYVQAAIQGGFEAFSLANNHCNDQGLDSMKATLKFFKELPGTGPLYHGLKSDPSAAVPAMVREVNGIRVGLVSFTSLLNQARGKEWAEFYPYADFYSSQVDEAMVTSLESRIREEKKSCDILIVGFHDGLEYVNKPFPAQVSLYRKLVEAGADVVWAHHPHVVLPVEVWPSGNRQGIILYSLGNFISGQAWRLGPGDKLSDRARTGDGVLVQVRVHRLKNGFFPVLGEIHHLNNYRHPLFGMITGLTRMWAETLDSPAWREFYQARLKIQEKVIENLP